MPEQVPWQVEDGRLRLMVRLTPRSARDAIEGIEVRDDGRAVLKARVRAVPEDGAANAALIRLVAKAAGVPASRITITTGHSARIKALAIEGDAEAAGAALLATIIRT